MTKDLLPEENIKLGVSFQDKYEAIRASGEILYENGYVEQEYITDMLHREDVITTCIGNGLAIPHGIANSEEDILCSGLSFIQVPEGVSFGEETAYIIIGIAGKNGDHLNLLSKVALAFCNLDTVEKFKKAKTKAEVRALLSLTD